MDILILTLHNQPSSHAKGRWDKLAKHAVEIDHDEDYSVWELMNLLSENCVDLINFAVPRNILLSNMNTDREGLMYIYTCTCNIIFGLFENISLIYIHPHCQWRAAKFRSLLCAHDLWGGKDLYSAIPALTGNLCLHGLVQRIASYIQGYWRVHSKPYPHRIENGVNSKQFMQNN